MICPNCNKEVKDDSKYCKYCGYSFLDMTQTITPINEKKINPNQYYFEEDTEELDITNINSEELIQEINEEINEENHDELDSNNEELQEPESIQEDEEKTIVLDKIDEDSMELIQENIEEAIEDDNTIEFDAFEDDEEEYDERKSMPLIFKILIALGIIAVIVCLVVFVLLPMFNKDNNEVIPSEEEVIVEKENPKMPNLLGLNEDEAKKLLIQNDIDGYTFTVEKTNDYEDGKVFYVSKDVGDEVLENDTITIKIAKNYEEIKYTIVEVNRLINLRTTPSTNSSSDNYIGKVVSGQKYIVKDEVEAEGYTWYLIGENKWFANDGTWAEVKEDKEAYEIINSAKMMIIIKESETYMPIYNSQNTSDINRDTYANEIHLVYDVKEDIDGTWYQIENNNWLLDTNSVIDILEKY